jgi:hypothetical protein
MQPICICAHLCLTILVANCFATKKSELQISACMHVCVVSFSITNMPVCVHCHVNLDQFKLNQNVIYSYQFPTIEKRSTKEKRPFLMFLF